MKHNSHHQKADRRYSSKSGATLLAERIRARQERAERARVYRAALETEVRAAGRDPVAPSMQALLDSATSAHLEIAKTTAQFVHGSVHAKSMLRLQFARSELRRALRALGLIRDDAESRNDDQTAPPAAPTEEAMADVVARFGGH
jgi:hypothetical protein